MQLHGFPTDIAHEACFLPAARLILGDQLRAECPLEHVWQHQDGRLHFKAGEAPRWRQRLQVMD
jgi:hypothetical protein